MMLVAILPVFWDFHRLQKIILSDAIGRKPLDQRSQCPDESFWRIHVKGGITAQVHASCYFSGPTFMFRKFPLSYRQNCTFINSRPIGRASCRERVCQYV